MRGAEFVPESEDPARMTYTRSDLFKRGPSFMEL